VDRLLAGLGAAARAARPAYHRAPEPERCVCSRADVPLWKDGVPLLGVLAFHGVEEAPGAVADLAPAPDRRGSPRFDFDLAVVNDGARPLRDIRLTLTFARRTPEGKRVGAVDRGLFWEGVLAPGAAVKWKVAAPGTEIRLDASVTGTLAQAHVDPAPADGFFHLTKSHFRAVRLHGALMLAYLRDPRAAAVARALSARGAGDDLLLARIRSAAAPVIACETRREGTMVEACIFNGSSQTRSGLSLREVTPPAGAAARSAPVPVPVPVHEGRRVRVEVPDDFGTELSVSDPTELE
jgi:hypothetical protein